MRAKEEVSRIIKDFAKVEVSVDEKILLTLVQMARVHHHIAVKECNGEITPTDETHRHYLEKRITKVADSLGFRVRFGGDPRGYTVKLHYPNLYNTWGGQESGYGIGEAS